MILGPVTKAFVCATAFMSGVNGAPVGNNGLVRQPGMPIPQLNLGVYRRSDDHFENCNTTTVRAHILETYSGGVEGSLIRKLNTLETNLQNARNDQEAQDAVEKYNREIDSLVEQGLSRGAADQLKFVTNCWEAARLPEPTTPKPPTTPAEPGSTKPDPKPPTTPAEPGSTKPDPKPPTTPAEPEPTTPEDKSTTPEGKATTPEDKPTTPEDKPTTPRTSPTTTPTSSQTSSQTSSPTTTPTSSQTTTPTSSQTKTPITNFATTLATTVAGLGVVAVNHFVNTTDESNTDDGMNAGAIAGTVGALVTVAAAAGYLVRKWVKSGSFTPPEFASFRVGRGQGNRTRPRPRPRPRPADARGNARSNPYVEGPAGAAVDGGIPLARLDCRPAGAAVAGSGVSGHRPRLAAGGAVDGGGGRRPVPENLKQGNYGNLYFGSDNVERRKGFNIAKEGSTFYISNKGNHQYFQKGQEVTHINGTPLTADMDAGRITNLMQQEEGEFQLTVTDALIEPEPVVTYRGGPMCRPKDEGLYGTGLTTANQVKLNAVTNKDNSLDKGPELQDTRRKLAKAWIKKIRKELNVPEGTPLHLLTDKDGTFTTHSFGASRNAKIPDWNPEKSIGNDSSKFKSFNYKVHEELDAIKYYDKVFLEILVEEIKLGGGQVIVSSRGFAPIVEDKAKAIGANSFVARSAQLAGQVFPGGKILKAKGDNIHANVCTESRRVISYTIKGNHQPILKGDVTEELVDDWIKREIVEECAVGDPYLLIGPDQGVQSKVDTAIFYGFLPKDGYYLVLEDEAKKPGDPVGMQLLRPRLAGNITTTQHPTMTRDEKVNEADRFSPNIGFTIFQVIKCFSGGELNEILSRD